MVVCVARVDSPEIQRLRRELRQAYFDEIIRAFPAELRMCEIDAAWHQAGHPEWVQSWPPSKQETPEVDASRVSTNRNSVSSESGGRYGKSDR